MQSNQYSNLLTNFDSRLESLLGIDEEIVVPFRRSGREEDDYR